MPLSAADELPPNADKIDSWHLGETKFEWEEQLKEAERLGLGSREYDLPSIIVPPPELES